MSVGRRGGAGGVQGRRLPRWLAPHGRGRAGLRWLAPGPGSPAVAARCETCRDRAWSQHDGRQC